ncbi:MAG TPA: serine/threonine-protein kinase [Gemmatimonadaceae bacterium]|nr:serine/threonine-protein kinase [Gemmatimonadaceae bacterium]
MDVHRWRKVQELLDIALETDPARWQSVLRERCGGDAALQREVEDLLSRLSSAESFLDSPPSALAAAIVAESTDTAESDQYIGRRLGAYRLDRQIGHGGMSRVYLAERTDGEFDQQVTVKLLRAGLDSPGDRERFRRERQILARLNHPNIAKLLDGGVTTDGVPYLVMEYVEGEAIDRYCKRLDLNLRDRLALFLTILDATQYAHRNLVVHRDLKPANILVTRDGVVKLLDFGLAKMLELDPSSPADAMTGTAQQWMTPEYAAPEQIQGEPVSTLTDIYQLGAVLYELLTGTLPFGRRGRSTYELEKAILNDDPPAPALGGDLDAIILKALHKEPEKRYASVDALADDLRRHLSSHPVHARAPSAMYRTQRYLRRHRIEAIAAAGIAFALLVGSVISLGAAQRAIAARDRAEVASKESEAVTTFLLDLFAANAPDEPGTDSITARELLRRGVARAEELSNQPDVQARLFETTGRIDQRLGSYAEGQALIERALQVRRRAHGTMSRDVANTLLMVSEGLLRLGRIPAADSAVREALAIQERILRPDDASIANTLDQLATVAMYRSEFSAAESYSRRSLELRRSSLGPNDTLTALSHLSYGSILFRLGQPARAEREYRDALAIYERAHGPNHPQVAQSVLKLAYVLEEDKTRWNEVEPLYRRGIAIRRRVYGDNNLWVANTLHDFSEFLSRRGDRDQALVLAREYLKAMRLSYKGDHSAVAFATSRLAAMLFRVDSLDEAERLFREAIAMERRARGPNHGNVAGHEVEFSRLLIARGKLDIADSLLRDAIRIRENITGPRDPNTAVARAMRGVILTRKHEYAAADSTLRDAIGILERTTTRAFPEVREMYGWLADLSDARSRPDEARRYRAIAAGRVATGQVFSNE